MVPPDFVERLRTTEVKEGDSVRFAIRVSGIPAPEVQWFRNGKAIVNSPDFEVLHEGDVHSLHIPEVFSEDAGKYTVKAENTAGHTQCTAELIVEGNFTQSLCGWGWYWKIPYPTSISVISRRYCNHSFTIKCLR